MPTHDRTPEPATSPADTAARLDAIEAALSDLSTIMEERLADLTATIQQAAREDTAAWLAMVAAVNLLGEETVPAYVEQFARLVILAGDARDRP